MCNIYVFQVHSISCTYVYTVTCVYTLFPVYMCIVLCVYYKCYTLVLIRKYKKMLNLTSKNNSVHILIITSTVNLSFPGYTCEICYFMYRYDYNDIFRFHSNTFYVKNNYCLMYVQTVSCSRGGPAWWGVVHAMWNLYMGVVGSCALGWGVVTSDYIIKYLTMKKFDYLTIVWPFRTHQYKYLFLLLDVFLLKRYNR